MKGVPVLTVSILINGQPIYTRTARNTSRTDDKGSTVYELDTGDILFHKPKHGAVALAKKMLDTIVESRDKVTHDGETHE
jgi:hypothetical protein